MPRPVTNGADTLVLGIETSCDETAVAVIRGDRLILSNIVSSQVDLHRRFGGVVPEIASRKHLETVNPILFEALEEAKVDLADIGAVAVAVGPGLMGALLIGLGVAKVVSYVGKLPLVGINHLEAHIYANFLEYPDLEPPLVCLIVSGGHTQIVFMPEHGEYQLMGQTLDDAAGEAFDKVAGFLGLGYPGGPIIDKIAKDGDPTAIAFPRAMMHTGDFNFSLSGLKTAVLYYVAGLKEEGKEMPMADLAASFQAAVVDVLVAKTIEAAISKGCSKIAISGGVAANSSLRTMFGEECDRAGFELFYPRPSLCTDNAAMIAMAGYYRFVAGESLGLEANPNPNLKLGLE